MKARIGIARTTSSHEYDSISIEIHDDKSNITICRGKITLENYAKVLTGLHGVEFDYEHGDLSKVGKEMEVGEHRFELPSDSYDREERLRVARDEAIATCPEGWKPDMYFGSRDSFYAKDGKNYARCTIRRWV